MWKKRARKQKPEYLTQTTMESVKLPSWLTLVFDKKRSPLQAIHFNLICHANANRYKTP